MLPFLQSRSRCSRHLAVAVSSILLLAACGQPTPTPGPGISGTAVPEATASPDEVIWALESEPVTLDAGRLALDETRGVLDPAGMQVAAQIYDRLVSFRPGTTQLAPGIAQTWQANPSENSFTFTLREGLVFHDGTPLDARAVAWNLNRWMDPAHPQHDGDFRAWEGLFGYLGQQDAEGNDAFIVESVEAIGPLQVRIELVAPFSPFLQHLAMVPFGLSSPTAVEAQDEAYGSGGANLPVGSGAFRVIAWDESGIRLIPFGRHWSGSPRASGLRFVTLPDPVERTQAVAEGRAHGASLSASPPVSVSLTAPGLRLLARPSRSSAWLMLDHSRPPLDNPRVRQAISLALDRQKLAQEHFGPASEPAGQLLPPGWLGHAEDVAAPARDLDQAKRIFEEEGIDGTFRLNIFVPEVARGYLPDPVGTAESIGAMLEELGITPSVRALGLRQFLSDRESGRFTAWIGGWEAQSPDPDNLWFFHFGIPGRFAAEGHYQNGDLARSLTAAQRMDTDSRREVYEAAARTVDAATARIFLAHARPLVVVNQRLRGLEPGVMGFDDLSQVSLGPEPPAGAERPTDGTPDSDIPTSVPLQPVEGEGEGTPTAGPDAAAAEGSPGPESTAADQPTAETSPESPAANTDDPAETAGPEPEPGAATETPGGLGDP